MPQNMPLDIASVEQDVEAGMEFVSVVERVRNVVGGATDPATGHCPLRNSLDPKSVRKFQDIFHDNGMCLAPRAA